MEIVFLSARMPLTKTFAMQNGELVSTPYPHASKLTSHHESAKSISDFKDLLVKHANKGHCLFGGQLAKPLQGESRAGMTAEGPKRWVVFDFDGVEGSSAADVVKRYLPKACQTVSYVAQLSASMFRPDRETWSGHIFMMLDKPADEKHLRAWLESLNFTNKELFAQLRLSDSQQALHWPLDRTVAYNSKLIFIAPPKCYGFKPAIEESITLVKKAKPTLTIPQFEKIETSQIKQRINDLRSEVGLDPISYDTTVFEDTLVLREAAEVVLHDVKTSGDNYIRFNLNGGDSYAYFIDLRKPELIRNFKGEPYLRTEDAAPDLWKQLKKVASRAVAKGGLEDGVEVLAFYATNQNSIVKIGSYDHATGDLVLNSSGERAAKAWQAEYGIVGGMLPHMDLDFDPNSDIQYVAGNRINLFKATPYMRQEPSSSKASSLAEIPPLLDKLMRSMLGDPTDEVYTHFMNWIAYIFKYRKKSTTAWVLSGTEGTGKGSFVKFVLAPVFGPSVVRTVQYGLLKQEFNDYLENALFVVFDEADTKAVDNEAALMAKLRHWITDDPITIRKMRTDPYQAPSYVNFLFSANRFTPVATSAGDRRFNIPERQETRLFFNPNEYRQLETGEHLPAFADVLHRWPIDEMAVTRVVDTQARNDVHEATTSINQLIADAVKRGDLQFFMDRTPSEAEAASDFHNRFNPIGMFNELIDRYQAAAQAGERVVVRDADLFVLFRTLVPDTRYFQDSKTWRKRHYKALGLDVDKQVRDPADYNSRVRGLIVEWKVGEPEKPAKPAKTVKSTKGEKVVKMPTRRKS